MTPARLEKQRPDYCLDVESISRRTLFRAIVRRNPRSQLMEETLELGHLSHTSDLERDLNTVALKNERRRPLQPGQNRCGRIE